MPWFYECSKTRDIILNLFILLYLLCVCCTHDLIIHRLLLWRSALILRLRVRAYTIFTEKHRVKVLADAIFHSFEICLFNAGIGWGKHFVVLIWQIEHQVLHEDALILPTFINHWMLARVYICIDEPVTKMKLFYFYVCLYTLTFQESFELACLFPLLIGYRIGKMRSYWIFNCLQNFSPLN